jgi:PIN domain nuclease of toxin-antitoxin system
MLLDTHTLLWFLNDDIQLPVTVRQRIEAADEVFVSIASLWEISIKLNIGKLSLTIPFESIDADIAASNIVILPITFADIVRYRSLPLHHRDPFDRMLVAQAIDRDYVLVSRDGALDAYGVKLLWE